MLYDINVTISEMLHWLTILKKEKCFYTRKLSYVYGELKYYPLSHYAFIKSKQREAMEQLDTYLQLFTKVFFFLNL